MPEGMARRSFFTSQSHEPFSDDPDVQLKEGYTTGPISFFNPTRARFHVPVHADADLEIEKPVASKSNGFSSQVSGLPGLEYRWRARDNRKGRHTLVIDPAAIQSLGDKVNLPPSTSTWRATALGIKRMFTEFPIWDVSYLVAQFFVWGSVVFTMNGLFYLLPLAYPNLHDYHVYGGGITSFIGCMLYQVGVIFLMLEAINENRTGCFGWALHKAFSHHDDSDDASQAKLLPTKDQCLHHHQNKGNVVGKGKGSTGGADASTALPLVFKDAKPAASSSRKWSWVPTWHELTTHYFREMGFLASLLMTVSATIYGMLGFCSLPPIERNISTPAFYGVFWTPDVLGSVGFVVASWLLMVETQPNWYTPAWHVIGWHANFWNVVGSLGFLLSATFGVCSSASASAGSMCLFQSDIHTTWGSAAFLIGSVILWYESLDKYPVEYKTNRS